MLSAEQYSELSIKKSEVKEQGINDSEMVEYLCDNTDIPAEEILNFLYS